jgi:trimeric autotransporter adhesin
MKKFMLIIPIIIIGNIFMLKAQNTSYGTNALSHNTTGNYNGAFGANSLFTNTTGSYNTAIGNYAMYLNTNGNYNTALGISSMFANINGIHNTANGAYSLSLNATGSYNIAIGNYALYTNNNGDYNSANGVYSMYLNSSGSFNTVQGYSALYKNTSGNYNTAIGTSTLYANTTGSNNTAIGRDALYNNTTQTANTAIGAYSNQSSNVFNTTAIGYYASITASCQIRIGNSSVTSIGGQVSWTTLSDGRFKKEIKHDVPGLDFINKLEPVSYIIDNDAFDDFLKIPDSLRIKNNNAPITQSGFIAQDVEKILKEMNISSFSGVDLPKNENDYYPDLSSKKNS